MAGRFEDMGPARLTGLMLALCGVASVALLAAHPGDDGPPLLAAVLRREAAQALPDAIVHGGFVVVLALEWIGFAALAVRSGPWRTPVIGATPPSQVSVCEVPSVSHGKPERNQPRHHSISSQTAGRPTK